MATAKEIGEVDEGPAQLVHDIGRVAEADVGIEHDRVAEREAEAFVRDFMSGKCYRGIEIGGNAEVGKVELLKRCKPLARRISSSCYPSRSAVGEAVVERLLVASG